MTYRIIRSSRKTVAIQIRADGEVVVRAPNRMSAADILRFVERKRSWIEKHQPRQQLPKWTDAEIQTLVQQAKAVIPARVADYAAILGVTYGRVTVRSQRTRWGSCSAKGNLNFNCLLMLAPEAVLDYVVVHELCHRKHMDHSPHFWAEVEGILPNYRESRRWLKENGPLLVGRLENP